MKLKGVVLTLFGTLLIAGCGHKKNPVPIVTPTPSQDTSPVAPTSEPITVVTPTDVTPSFIPTSSEEPKYEKDEQGFYILEDDYYQHIDFDENKLSFAEKISGVKYADNYRLYYGDTEIPLYGVNTNPARTWTPDPSQFVEAGVGIINLEGSASFTLQTNFAFKEQSTHFLPSSSGVNLDKDFNRRTLSFTINKCGQYTISFLKSMSFHLYVHPIGGFNSDMNNSNKIVFSKGLHNKSNDSRIGSNSFINLSSNTTVILEQGAVVEAGFIANNASDIEIIGDGVVLGANFSRSASKNTRLIPYEFNYCTNISFKGISTFDPAGWCYNIYFCNQVYFDDIKIISSRSNGDGVSLQSSKNVTCINSFVRSWDDSLVVKNYPKWSNRNEYGSTQNIHFSNCQIWTELAQCMELGYETVGETFEDIYFEDITVLYAFHKAVMSIHNGNNAFIKNVHFDNIVVENARMGLGDGNQYLIDFVNIYSSTWSNQHARTALGFIEGVYVNNVTVKEGSSRCLINVSGTKDKRDGYDKNVEHFVKNVNIHNVFIYDQYLTNNDEKLVIGDYVYNLSITNGYN